ncbi:MAG: ABC transporter permease [Phycisphaerales bacterium]
MGVVGRTASGRVGLVVLALMALACVLSVPWTFGAGPDGRPRYDAHDRSARLLPPTWWPMSVGAAVERQRVDSGEGEVPDGAAGSAASARVRGGLMGTDLLGRDLLVRVLAGGAISLLVGVCAAAVAVTIGTAYGLIAGYAGGRIDAVMMRVVDVLYGLPYVLLVVLLAVASDAIVERWSAAGLDLSESARRAWDVGALLLAIGGVSWLTMARVVRGQVLSLKAQPFMEAARAMGVPVRRQLLVHLLPNLGGPIVVYATLTVPQAILQESFLSFLGIGIKAPLPSWGTLASDGLSAMNAVSPGARAWLLVFPCLALSATLLALNFVGEGLREALDPRRARD